MSGAPNQCPTYEIPSISLQLYGKTVVRVPKHPQFKEDMPIYRWLFIYLRNWLNEVINSNT